MIEDINGMFDQGKVTSIMSSYHDLDQTNLDTEMYLENQRIFVAPRKPRLLLNSIFGEGNSKTSE